MTTIIDTHCHIYYDDFKADFEQMLVRASDAGVTGMVVAGADLDSSRKAVALTEKHQFIYCAVGIHPHDAATAEPSVIEAIRSLATGCNRCVAIGEIGLDFYRNRSPRDVQEQVFRKQLELAKELGLPVVIHDRDAHDKTLSIIREAGVRKGVMHCFSGDYNFAAQCIEQGFYISIPGTVTYSSNEQLRDVVRKTAIEHLLLETDAPYLSPVPNRGKRNEPSYTRITAEKVAELKGLTVEDVGRITTMNAGRLFNIELWDSGKKIAYRIRNSLYLNITNKCSNRCIFCAKFSDFTVKGHNLLLDKEPEFDEVMAAIGEPDKDIREIVFCGFGESLLRLQLVKEVAGALKKRGYRIRINSDGQANLAHGRNILPELAGLVDSLSISLNAHDAETYSRLCNTPFGSDGFKGICSFLHEAVRYVPDVTATAVTVPEVDIAACHRLAESIGVKFRIRQYDEVG